MKFRVTLRARADGSRRSVVVTAPNEARLIQGLNAKGYDVESFAAVEETPPEGSASRRHSPMDSDALSFDAHTKPLNATPSITASAAPRTNRHGHFICPRCKCQEAYIGSESRLSGGTSFHSPVEVLGHGMTFHRTHSDKVRMWRCKACTEPLSFENYRWSQEEIAEKSRREETRGKVLVGLVIALMPVVFLLLDYWIRNSAAVEFGLKRDRIERWLQGWRTWGHFNALCAVSSLVSGLCGALLTHFSVPEYVPKVFEQVDDA